MTSCLASGSHERLANRASKLPQLIYYRPIHCTLLRLRLSVCLSVSAPPSPPSPPVSQSLAALIALPTLVIVFNNLPIFSQPASIPAFCSPSRTLGRSPSPLVIHYCPHPVRLLLPSSSPSPRPVEAWACRWLVGGEMNEGQDEFQCHGSWAKCEKLRGLWVFDERHFPHSCPATVPNETHP